MEVPVVRSKWHLTGDGEVSDLLAAVGRMAYCGPADAAAACFDQHIQHVPVRSDPGENHMRTSTWDPYVLKNADVGAGDMLSHLAEVLDAISKERLVRAGLGPGDSFLELGAGRGTIAGWAAERIGPDGAVIAADIDPRHVQVPEQVEVRALNVITDKLPVVRRIHARCLLAHLPTRVEVLARMVAACEPGGTITVEEWGQDAAGYVAASADANLPAVYGRYQLALQAAFRRQGNDPSWARRVPAAMIGAGLIDVEFTVMARSWRGGEAGTLLPHAVSVQLHDELVDTGLVTGRELEQMRQGLLDPDTLVQANGLHSVTGRKPWDAR
jgi:SAM-dependent methyltransferase